MLTDSSVPLNSRELRRILWLMASGHGLAHMYLLVLPPLYPVISTQLGLSYTQLGIIFSAAAFSLGISQMAVGLLSDWIGHRWLLIGGQLLMSFAVLGSGLAYSFWSLLVLQAVCGAAGSVMHPVAVSLLVDVMPDHQKGRALGMHGTGGQLGNAMAPVVTVFLTVAYNWRVALVTVGAAGVVLALWMLRSLDDLSSETAKASDVKRVSLSSALPYGKLALVLALLIWVSRGVASRAYQSFLPTFLIDQYNFSLERSSVFITSYWLFAAGASMVGGYLADRFNQYVVLWLTSFFTMAALAVLLFPQSLTTLIIYGNFFLLGIFSFLGRPAFYGIYAEGFKKVRSGTLYAIGFTTAYTFSAGIPGAMGWLTDLYGAAVAFYPVLATMLLPLIILPALKYIRVNN